jgi:hypothetical protein
VDIYVNPLTAAYDSLTKINEERAKTGRPALSVKAADKNLLEDDLVEMVNAGLIPATVAMQHRANLWSRVLPNIKLQPQITIENASELAWVLRKDNPELKRVLDEFIINTSVIHGTELIVVTPRPRPSYAAPQNAVVAPKEFQTFFDKYFYPSSLRQKLRYHPSSGGGDVGRASYAASRILITCDNSGNGRLNTSYLLGALTSVAVDTAYRPYWARSTSATFNNFGSTIGSDAGMNLVHEFGPGFRQMVKNHQPKFVSRIGERIIYHQTPTVVISTPAR